METKTVEEIQTMVDEIKNEAAYLAGRLAAEKREKSWWVGASYGILASLGVLIISLVK